MAETRVETLLLTGYGINAEEELGRAFERAGSIVRYIHLHDVVTQPAELSRAGIIAIPGGFSYGDHLGSGKVLASLLASRLRAALASVVKRGGLVLGICNGFQVLAKMGMLPNLSGTWSRQVSLIHNESGAFIDSWVRLAANSRNRSPWLAGIGEIELPIRHGEGRFVTSDPEVLRALNERELVAFRYDGNNPNGSQDDIAGITDTTGRVLGMMPHPEAYLARENHPRWTREHDVAGGFELLFQNAVAHVVAEAERGKPGN